MPIKPTPPPLWTNTFDLTAATLPPGKAALGNEVLNTGGVPGGGTVTSVGLDLPASTFSVTGSPVTTAGTLTGAFTTQTANFVFAGPATGIPAVPTWRALVAADIPGLTPNAITALTNDVTATGPGSVPAQVNRITFNVNQTAHGFVVGNVISDGTSSWAKANNGTSTLTADAIVCTVTDADNFVAQQLGTLTLTTGQWDAVCGTSGGLTRGNYYWVDSTAGLMTSTQPSGSSNFQQCCIKAMSTTQAEVLLPSDALQATATGYSGDGSTIILNGLVFSALPDYLQATLSGGSI